MRLTGAWVPVSLAAMTWSGVVVDEIIDCVWKVVVVGWCEFTVHSSHEKST